MTKVISKRKTILDTALSLFKQYSFKFVGVDRIINESQVAKMTFYKYFPSKTLLIQACLCEEQKTIEESILRELSLLSEAGNMDRLKALLIGTSRISTSKILMAVFFQKAVYENEVGVEVLSVIQAHKQWKFKLVSDLMEVPECSTAFVSSSMVYSMLEGMLLPANINPCADHETAIKSLIQTFEA
ncbi:TetR/AcrR family transcriptional regulator (plasmid) [Acinetobacter baumannii]